LNKWDKETRTKKVHRYEVRGMREREKVNSKSKLEKLLEQNVTYTLR
jgi:hypothetical protein